MKQRYLIITLSFFIALGAYVHPVGAADCTVASTCMPELGSGHLTGAHRNHCFCSQWGMRSGGSCRLEKFPKSFQPVIGTPVTKFPAFQAIGLSAGRWYGIHGLYRKCLPRLINKTDTPYPYPIYLQTLALLC